MARAVTCFATKEKGSSDDFIKMDGHYFKNQAVYDSYIENKKLYTKIISLIAIDLMDYSPGQPFPPLIGKRLKELEFYDRKIIYQTIVEIKNDLIFAMSRTTFKNDAGRISYIFAAIKNHINDVYKKEKAKEKVAKIASKKFAEEAALFEVDTEIKHTKQKVRDLSKFLDEE